MWLDFLPSYSCLCDTHFSSSYFQSAKAAEFLFIHFKGFHTIYFDHILPDPYSPFPDHLTTSLPIELHILSFKKK